MGLMAIVEIKKLMLITGASFAITGCLPEPQKQTVPPPVVREVAPPTDLTQETLTKIHQEVVRLARIYPPDSLINRVYLGNLSDLSPVFRSPMRIGIADPSVAYARTAFTNLEHTPHPRFRYFLYRDGSIADYQTLTGMDITIYFSPRWLEGGNDQVKALGLEKEAFAVGLWEAFSRITLNTYIMQGRIDKVDPQVKEAEIARTLARQLLMENDAVRKLYDYAGYLAIMPKVSILLSQHDPNVEQELGVHSNFLEIYRRARARSIDFDSLNPNSKEFLQLAFDPNSPWTQMILDPDVPGPRLLP